MKRKLGKRQLAAVLAVAMLWGAMPAALAAPDGTPSVVVEAETAALSGVTLSSGSLAMTVGETKDVTATIQMSDGTTYSPGSTLPSGMTVSWKVKEGREDEVGVSWNGQNALTATVTAKGTAETNEDKMVPVTVTITYGTVTKEATCQVTVSPAEAAGVTVTPANVEIAPGATAQLTASVQPETAPQTVTWSSADPEIATVDQTGLVTGVSAGEVKISAAANGKTAECIVTVQGIVLDDDSVTLKENGSYTLRYQIFGDSLGDKVEWSSSAPTVVTVSDGYLRAYQAGEATITAQVSGSVYTDSCKVTVERVTAEVITKSVDAGEPLRFSELVSDIEKQCNKVLGSGLSYVSGLWVDTRQGTLYYRYQSSDDTGAGIGTAERYYTNPTMGQMGLDDVTFVPKPDFSGTAVISYSGYTADSAFFQGTIEVDVEEQKELTYNVSAGSALQLDVEDFNRMCRSQTGRDLNYVMFSLPDSAQGTLYCGYISAQLPGTKVDASKQYRRNGSPSLAEVYFVPADGFDGEVVIPYTGYDVNGVSFRSRMTIRVTGSGTSSQGDLSYKMSQGDALTLDVDDFNDLSKDLTGYALDYVQFSLPSAGQGTLYYDYDKSGEALVKAGESYYRSKSPYLRRVSFVAKSTYEGVAYVDFTGWDVKGNRFSGTVEIQVGSSGEGEISYTVTQGGQVTLDADDFREVCRSLTGGTLKYVQFDLPASSAGALWYDYGNQGAQSVSESKKYYVSSSPYLDQVTFVANPSFSGVAEVDFTGWSSSGKKMEGVVKITVEKPASLTLITYQAPYGAVTFRSQDFAAAYGNRSTGSLISVQFSLPASSQGSLYYQYDSTTGSGLAVRSGVNYYVSGTPEIGEVTFAAAPAFEGTVTISYTATDSQGITYPGQIQVIVEGQSGSRYFSDLDNYDWAAASVDYLYQAGVVTGVGTGLYGPARQITRGDFILMLDRAFDLPDAAADDFADVPADSYYAQAIRNARALGIAAGYPDGGFHPNDAISRQDAMVLLKRTMQADGWSLGAGNTSLLDSFTDGGQVASYARDAMATMIAFEIIAGTPEGWLNPGAPMTRAEMAVVLTRVLSM